MPKKDYLHVTLVADKSGSMEDIRDDAQGSINALIADQANLPAGLCTFLFNEFSSHNHRVFGPDDIKRCPRYELVPSGGTAMLDAIGDALIDTDALVDGLALSEQPEKIIVAVVTDGAENSSRRYTYDTIRKMVSDREAKGWEFSFLAANQDAALTGEQIAMKRSTNYAGTAKSVGATYTTLSSSISHMRTASVRGQTMATSSMVMPESVDEEGNVTWGADFTEGFTSEETPSAS